VQGLALWSQQPHETLLASGRVAGKLPGRKGPGVWVEHEPAMCTGDQAGQRHPGLYH